MLQDYPVDRIPGRTLGLFLKSCFGLTESAFVNAVAISQTYAKSVARSVATLTQIDWASAIRRLNELPKKSKEAMVVASSRGWFFGWYDSLDELIVLIEKLTVVEQPHVDEFIGQYYRNNLERLTRELVDRHPNRAAIIKAAVSAHNASGTDGYLLSIPVFIAQADGLLTEIAEVKSATMKASRNTRELQASAALRKRLDTDQAALDLIHPILKLHELDLMKSASERARTAQASGAAFTALNRHQVLHGECSDYGTEMNSLKAFSFLTFVGLHLPMVLESPLREFHRTDSRT